MNSHFYPISSFALCTLDLFQRFTADIHRALIQLHPLTVQPGVNPVITLHTTLSKQTARLTSISFYS